MKEIATSSPIYSITPFTLLDYEHHSACILWFTGCNMRCLYCYNPEIVLGKGSISFEKTLSFLKSRINLLDGVVFSGGECLLHKNILELIQEVKKMGFKVKIDTNGSKPEILEKLIQNQLIDYVALDFKALPTTFEKITQSSLFESFEQSFHVLLQYQLPFEVRTTVHSDLLKEKDIREMIDYLENHDYTGNYYLQHFVNDVQTLEKLEYSNKQIQKETLSTSKINICFRG